MRHNYLEGSDLNSRKKKKFCNPSMAECSNDLPPKILTQILSSQIPISPSSLGHFKRWPKTSSLSNSSIQSWHCKCQKLGSCVVLASSDNFQARTYTVLGVHDITICPTGGTTRTLCFSTFIRAVALLGERIHSWIKNTINYFLVSCLLPGAAQNQGKENNLL